MAFGITWFLRLSFLSTIESARISNTSLNHSVSIKTTLNFKRVPDFSRLSADLIERNIEFLSKLLCLLLSHAPLLMAVCFIAEEHQGVRPILSVAHGRSYQLRVLLLILIVLDEPLHFQNLGNPLLTVLVAYGNPLAYCSCRRWSTS